MSITYISSQDLNSHQYTEFNINAAKDGKSEALAAIYNTFIPLLDLTYGKVFKRGDNGELWHVSPGDSMARRITEERFQIFLSWDTHTLLPGDDLFSKLTGIGGLPAGEYSLTADYIQFPCKVRTAKGESMDLCILHFSAAPPYQTYFKNIVLLDDIVDVEPSDLALAHDLRLESMLADEIRMSFYPFMLKTKAGELLLYNGTTEFVSNGKVKGSDIECQVPFSHDAKYNVVDVSLNDITYVIGKWDNRFQKLFADYRQLLADKKADKTGFKKRRAAHNKRNNNIFGRLWNLFRAKYNSISN